MGHPEVWGRAGDRLLVVGLTGGIASGKTEVDRALEDLGATVIDADAVARDVVQPGLPAYEACIREFGEGILGPDARIDRASLAALVFSDEEKRRLLNSITHPRIVAEIVRRVNEKAENLLPDDVPAVVIDAALIVDIGATAIFDLLLVVTTPEETRVGRMLSDRGMSEDEARSRIASQIPEDARVEMADLVITNDGSLRELREAVGRVWGEISERARSAYQR
ncbi:MAG: dephospho-CoA kinase [Actinomycetota bacterium]